ncbi:hypothetical protein KKA14_04415 [bacterium]|nr:hypothetical protein [bacterium]
MKHFCLLILFAGLCSCGSVSRQEIFLPIADISKVNGMSYYLLESGYHCASNTPEKTVILSWKNRLEFNQGEVLIWGDLCNDQADVIKFEPGLFKFSKDFSKLIYQNKIHARFFQKPTLCEAGLWCPVEKTK